MSSEAEAGFLDFLSLWQSSDTLRLRICQFVQNALAGKDDGPRAKSTDRKTPTEGHGVGIPSLSGLLAATDVEKRLAQSYGGLTRKELMVLLEKHKAGNRDVGAYLLVRAWKQFTAGSSQSLDPRLKLLTLDCLSQAISRNRADFFRQMADILEFLKGEEFQANGQWDHDPGQWWQFHLLLYVLEHPKDKYLMREFVSYFETEIGADAMPTTKTLRSFCHSVGIALDSTPGPSRKL